MRMRKTRKKLPCELVSYSIVSTYVGLQGTYDSEPSEKHADALVEELNHEHEVATNGMVAAENLVEMCKSVDCSEETAVQPTSSLKNEISHLGGHISLAGSGLDVLQNPRAVAL